MKRFEKLIKEAALSLLRLMWGSSLAPEAFRREGVCSIVVVRQDERLGNMVLIAPFLSGLRKAFPDASVTLVASEKYGHLFNGDKRIDRLVLVNKKRCLFNPVYLLKTIQRLRNIRADLAFDLSDAGQLSVLNGAVTRLVGARLRIGFDRTDVSTFLNRLVPVPEVPCHATEMHLRLLEALVPGSYDSTPAIRVDAGAREWAKEWLQRKRQPPESRLVAVHIGARGPKQWGVENFFELIERLTADGNVKVVVITGPQEHHLLQQRKKDDRNVLFAPAMSVPQLAALLSLCDLYVGNDAGPLHLAVAVGTTTVAIFFTSDAPKYGPQGKKHIILATPGRKPSVAEVYQSIRSALTEVGRPGWRGQPAQVAVAEEVR
jgi:ADP-heptose:LPS heptosyltransferase